MWSWRSTPAVAATAAGAADAGSAYDVAVVDTVGITAVAAALAEASAVVVAEAIVDAVRASAVFHAEHTDKGSALSAWELHTVAAASGDPTR